MTKNELWKIYTDKNPKWKEDGVALTASGLQKLFDQIWKHAHEEGHEKGYKKGRDNALSLLGNPNGSGTSLNSNQKSILNKAFGKFW